MNKKNALFLALLLCCQPVMASEKQVAGFNIGIGETNYRATGYNDSSEALAFAFYYRYLPAENWGIEAGWTAQTDGLFSSPLSRIFGAEESSHETDAYKLALFGQYNMAGNNMLYAKLGTAFVDSKVFVGDKNLSSNSIGILTTLGWEYRFQSGIGVSLEYEFIGTHDVTNRLAQLGISYHF